MEVQVESFQQQALEVRQPDEDFDPSLEPQNGEEFLMKMIFERNRCPAVVVKKPKTIQQPEEVSVKAINEMSEINDISPTNLRPTSQWKDAQEVDFLRVRAQITNTRNNLEACGYTSESTLPLVDDDDIWKEFCRTNPPVLSTILRINQRSLEQLLEFISQWLKDDLDGELVDLSATTNSWLGSWTYSTLACLILPLEPDVHSNLRDIAKTCIGIRNTLNPQDQVKVAPCNLFIFIIAKVFGQLDLADFV